jgi:hypothetical protein
MPNVVTKAALSPARRRLVELMQEINYGRIERLEVRDGEPVFDPPPTVLRLFLFGKDNGPNASRGNDGFALKKKVAELFEVFDRERSLSIQELMIDNGLPVRMTVADAARA